MSQGSCLGSIQEKKNQGAIIRKRAIEALGESEQAPKKKTVGPKNTKDQYVQYLQDKLELDRQQFELERREREARLERDRELMALVVSLTKKNSE